VPAKFQLAARFFHTKKDQRGKLVLLDVSCYVLTNQTQSNLCMINVPRIAPKTAMYSPIWFPPTINIAPTVTENIERRAAG
jgi:hypothetical protein